MSEDVWRLLELLADGQFHSGEALGQCLGVSRAAVWKRLRQLEALQLQVERRPGLGYRLHGGLDLLDAQVLASAVPATAGRLEVLRQVDSTNTHLLQSPHCPAVCLAELQTAGRGRRGRQWLSVLAGSLCFSQSWVFQGGAAALQGLSLAVGVVLVDALEALGARGLALKWPNDLLLDGAKLGGILIELVGDAAGECRVVVGVGLNLGLPSSLRAAVGQPSSDIRAAGVHHSRTTVAAACVTAMTHLLETYATTGFGPYRRSWESRNAYAGCEVILSTPAEAVVGVLRGVDGAGALVLDTDSGAQVFTGGEISLRKRHAAS